MRRSCTLRSAACPLRYRYGAAALSREKCKDSFHCDTLWAAGGLYGNVPAFVALQERVRRDGGAARMVFNGDFNFFNGTPALWEEVNDRVLGSWDATAGNVEVEAADPSPSLTGGCGCAYPDYVDSAVECRASLIVNQLREAADAASETCRKEVASLPYFMACTVGPLRVGIVHGDPESLSGWGLAAEALEERDSGLVETLGLEKSTAVTTHEMVATWMREGQVGALLSSHTCLPAARVVHADHVPGGLGAVFNNGAAGLPNFAPPHGPGVGIATRVSADLKRIPEDALYGVELPCGVRIDAIPFRWDDDRWLAQFGSLWREGSPAAVSYGNRIRHGVAYYTPQQAFRACP
eukprot:TRINITY_DN43570_c0_g1_i1.p1 TRINITY_DN43570_c0_g1~~TRINITY_DN43570_c0_g1_i1.p1  ORF type:complete len:351 (+),score=82.38 TRINITY_DN43570_c0_g1_i1:57-1109(+)